jgi:hypothetical protein
MRFVYRGILYHGTEKVWLLATIGVKRDLQNYQAKTARQKGGRLEKFSITAMQAIHYFDSISAEDAITLHDRLRAKYPIRARTFQLRVYEYYDPDEGFRYRAAGSFVKPCIARGIPFA